MWREPRRHRGDLATRQESYDDTARKRDSKLVRCGLRWDTYQPSPANRDGRGSTLRHLKVFLFKAFCGGRVWDSSTVEVADSSLFGRWWSSAFRLTTPIFVARGPALLFGISRWLSQHGISRKRRNNLTRVLIAVERSTQESKANSSHPSSRHRPARDIVALDCGFVAPTVWRSSLRLSAPFPLSSGTRFHHSIDSLVLRDDLERRTEST